MADSNITKKALASALKELLGQLPFSKITISDICQSCHMNRKSFYYHFKDKYDLVNWIFDSEFIAVVTRKVGADAGIWQRMTVLLDYFYENHEFYRKVLSIEGQNSFSEHFRELLFCTVCEQMKDLFPSRKAQEFQVNFFSDALVMAIQRWMIDPDPMLPEEFLEQCKIAVRFCMDLMAQLPQS